MEGFVTKYVLMVLLKSLIRLRMLVLTMSVVLVYEIYSHIILYMWNC